MRTLRKISLASRLRLLHLAQVQALRMHNIIAAMAGAAGLAAASSAKSRRNIIAVLSGASSRANEIASINSKILSCSPEDTTNQLADRHVR